MRTANEARVGVVVVAAIALALMGYFFLRGTAPGADLYYLVINGPANIAEGNDVRLQGVKIGEVREVTLDPQTQKPLLTLAVQPSKLLRHYQYTIRTNSLIGEPYVDISGVYNPSQNYSPGEFYAANDKAQIIVGKPMTNIADISEQATTIGKDFRVTLQKLNVTIDRINKGVLSPDSQAKLIRALESVTRLTTEASKSFGSQGIKIGFGDARAQEAFNRTLQNSALAAQEAGVAARTISSSVNGLSGQMNGVLRENRGQLRGLLQNLSATAKNVSGLTESLTFVVKQSGFAENSQLAFRSLRRAAENVEAGTSGFKALGGDAKTQQNLRDTVDALRVTTESLRDVATSIKGALGDPGTQAGLRTALQNINDTTANIEQATSNLADITGGFKNVIGDADVQQNLKETVANMNGTLAATRAAAERINGLLGGRKPKNTEVSGDAKTEGDKTEGDEDKDGDGKKDKKSKKVELGSGIPTGPDFTLRHVSSGDGKRRNSSGGTFGDLTFNAALFGSPFRLGISEIGESNGFTLQGGRYIGQNGVLRYGLYRSKLSIGAQYNAGRFSLEGNLYDPNRRSANVYAGFAVTPQLEIIAGREHTRGVQSNAIGVRLRP